MLEWLAPNGDKEWRLRVHEGEIRQVLESSINAENELIRARAAEVPSCIASDDWASEDSPAFWVPAVEFRTGTDRRSAIEPSIGAGPTASRRRAP